MVSVVRDGKMTLAPDDEVDFELPTMERTFGSHINLIPLQANVQGPRLFYGARFYNQAVPLVQRESPLVRNQNTETGRSYDFEMGSQVGALFADGDGTVDKVTPDELTVRAADGQKRIYELYNNFPHNRMTMIHHTPRFKKGEAVLAGQLLAGTNYTDDEGRLALGRNVRVGLVAHEGYGMDDALEVSASMARKLTSEHIAMAEHENDPDVRLDRKHFIALFPKTFDRKQLGNLDDEGVVKPGTILQPGDPIMLRTKPRTFSSGGGADASRLSRSSKFVRKDASQVWEGHNPAEVVDVVRHAKGLKIMMNYQAPAEPGDKIVFRAGQKGTISRIIPDELMPHTRDGEPLEVLLNQLGLPSRVNGSLYHELLLGKIARKRGKAFTLPSFRRDGKSWVDFVEEELEKAGLEDAEDVFDPGLGKYLEKPITVGVGHVLKLHHVASHKIRQRGQGGYDINHQPMKGGSEMGGAQRFSGLETGVALSSGAYNLVNENSTLRGEFNDDYWRAIRSNRTPKRTKKPFVWEKFNVLLNGAGIEAQDRGEGVLRLVPFTDKALAKKKSRAVKSGGIVNMKTLEPIKGGLFDPSMVRNQEWGHIDLPFEIINPSYEDNIRTLLGLTKKEYDAMVEAELR